MARSRNEEESGIEKTFSMKNIVIGVVALFVLITICKSCTIVSPNERGIDVTLGEMSENVIQPGMHFHAPWVTKTRCFKLEPQTYEVTFNCGGEGAITKDMQTVGATVAVRYMYDELRIKDIVTKYANGSIIEEAMKDNVKASLKETTGKYSIYELVGQQNAITSEVASAMLERMKDYPIAISQTTITNWDWSSDFDSQIKETANKNQQIKQAEAEANIAAAQAQKLVKEAEAKKEAEKLNAEAAVLKAQGEADAQKVRADAELYQAQQLQKAQSMKQAEWTHEERMKELEKWDGKKIPDYVPLNPTGGVVTLPGRQ